MGKQKHDSRYTFISASEISIPSWAFIQLSYSTYIPPASGSQSYPHVHAHSHSHSHSCCSLCWCQASRRLRSSTTGTWSKRGKQLRVGQWSRRPRGTSGKILASKGVGVQVEMVWNGTTGRDRGRPKSKTDMISSSGSGSSQSENENRNKKVKKSTGTVVEVTANETDSGKGKPTKKEKVKEKDKKSPKGASIDKVTHKSKRNSSAPTTTAPASSTTSSSPSSSPSSTSSMSSSLSPSPVILPILSLDQDAIQARLTEWLRNRDAKAAVAWLLNHVRAVEMAMKVEMDMEMQTQNKKNKSTSRRNTTDDGVATIDVPVRSLDLQVYNSVLHICKVAGASVQETQAVFDALCTQQKKQRQAHGHDSHDEKDMITENDSPKGSLSPDYEKSSHPIVANTRIVSPDQTSFHVFISVLLNHKQWQRAVDVIQDMTRSNTQWVLQSAVLGEAMRAHYQRHDYQALREVFQIAQKFHVRLDTADFNLYMNVCSRRSKVSEEDHETVAGTEVVQPSTSTSTSSSISDSNTSDLDYVASPLEETTKIYQLMLQNDIAPDQETFDALILAALNSKQPHMAWHWLKNAMSSGIRPSIDSFKTCMSIALEQEKWKPALKLLYKWQKDYNRNPDVEMYQLALRACRFGRNVDLSREILFRLIRINQTGLHTRVDSDDNGDDDDESEEDPDHKNTQAHEQDRTNLTSGSPNHMSGSPNHIALDVESFHLTMLTMADAGDLHGVYHIYRIMNKLHISPNIQTYTAMLRACRVANFHRGISTVRDRICHKGLEMDLEAYTELMAAYEQAGKWKKVLDVFKELQSLNIEPTVHIYKISLLACERGGLEDKVHQLLRILEWQNVILNVAEYNALIKVCAEKNDGKRALFYLSKMKLRGVKPNQMSYELCVKACINSGLDSEANELKKKYLRSGSAFATEKPVGDVWTYNHRMSALRNTENWEAALALLTEMDRNGIIPDRTTYASCMSVMESAGNWKGAMQLLELMQSRQIEPDIVIYSHCINACAKAGKDSLALELWTEMKDKGIKPNLIAYSACIDVLAHKGRWNAARNLLNQMKQDGEQPNLDCYNSCIKACQSANHWELAWSLLEEMQRSNIQPDVTSYLMCIEICDRANQKDKARSLLEKGGPEVQYHINMLNRSQKM